MEVFNNEEKIGKVGLCSFPDRYSRVSFFFVSDKQEVSHFHLFVLVTFEFGAAIIFIVVSQKNTHVAAPEHLLYLDSVLCCPGLRNSSFFFSSQRKCLAYDCTSTVVL